MIASLFQFCQYSVFIKNKFHVLERNKSMSWVIKQLFHAFMGNSQNHRSRSTVDALLLTASGNSASGCPQYLGSNNFDCCPRGHEIGVYCYLMPVILFKTFEPAGHDKTNKITFVPAKTPVSMGIHRVWLEFQGFIKYIEDLAWVLMYYGIY